MVRVGANELAGKIQAKNAIKSFIEIYKANRIDGRNFARTISECCPSDKTIDRAMNILANQNGEEKMKAEYNTCNVFYAFLKGISSISREQKPLPKKMSDVLPFIKPHLPSTFKDISCGKNKKSRLESDVNWFKTYLRYLGFIGFNDVISTEITKLENLTYDELNKFWSELKFHKNTNTMFDSMKNTLVEMEFNVSILEKNKNIFTSTKTVHETPQLFTIDMIDDPKTKKVIQLWLDNKINNGDLSEYLALSKCGNINT